MDSANLDVGIKMEYDESEDKTMKATSSGLRWPRLHIILISLSLIIVMLLSATIVWELKTSWFQAQILTSYASKLTFRPEPGPSSSIRFPDSGPHDKRSGYTYMGKFTDRLLRGGYSIEEQSRMSPRLAELTDRGLFQIYREKSRTGLRILDRENRVLFANQYPMRVYETFDSIPHSVVKTLVFIENRELLDPRYPYHNPAIEWDRLAKAVFDLALQTVFPDHEVAGGSTLATQIEKYRHSPEGRTSSLSEKLRQMTTATLRVYLNGAKTLETQRLIVLDYVNSIPLAAIPGYGEVHGLGDGLWAWYGVDFDSVNKCLSGGGDVTQEERVLAYKQVLSLFLAHRRPSYYLVENQDALRSLTNNYTSLLANARIISRQMEADILKAQLNPRQGVPAKSEKISFLDRKAPNAIRAELLTLLDVPSLYDLDRIDLTVNSTLDMSIQQEVTEILKQLSDPEYALSSGLIGERLLSQENLSRVVYSFTLYEHIANANLLRVQADTLNQPFNINEGVKLELGSTAKLRTLASYLEIIAELHEKYAGRPREDLRKVQVSKSDTLSQWAISYLSFASDKSLRTMLKAAMDRRYSASPHETFFTGGGQHTFVNFDNKHNSQVMSVRDGLLNSVNLIFIRLMRDVVRYYMFQLPNSAASILEDIENPDRQIYLRRFADQEGRVFLNRFYRKYKGKGPEESMTIVLQGVRPVPNRLATVFRSVAPDVGLLGFEAFMRSQLPGSRLDKKDMADLYEKYSQSSFNLNDRGYIARVHPLELWTLEYLRQHPDASWKELVQESADERQEVYTWLFKTGRKHKQDIRIRTLLEAEAFQLIHEQWKRLGYPFGSLVPSYATAIGSSADRPSSLAELIGVILNDGIRYPSLRIQELHFAEGTPYETLMQHGKQAGESVLKPEVAEALQSALAGVVEEGTAQRLRHVFSSSDGSFMVVGGKTGTGDNRREVYGSGGRLISSVAINRTATFIFFIGDRFFGVMTAYVDGPVAARYGFTSTLPVQIMKIMSPKLMPILDGKGNTPPKEPNKETNPEQEASTD